MTFISILCKINKREETRKGTAYKGEEKLDDKSQDKDKGRPPSLQKAEDKERDDKNL
ncbi:MAG: hypothetical protein NTW09_05870 [Candidatus Omnitrophica bacterium]|nr:hypothetical protein [Candidatus Omnitrophota bacterium]